MRVRRTAALVFSILLSIALISTSLSAGTGESKQYYAVDLGASTQPASAFILNSQGVLNNSGQVVGGAITYYPDRPPEGIPFLWKGQDITALPAGPNRISVAMGINDNHEIAAWSTNPQMDDAHSYLLRDGTWISLPDLTDPTHPNTKAGAINNRGTVIGLAYNQMILGYEDSPTPVAWFNGQIMALPVLNLGGGRTPNVGDTLGINDLDQIVGRSGDWFLDEQGNFHGPLAHATLWENGVAYDLNDDTYGDYSDAWSINNNGLIVGEIVQNSNVPGSIMPASQHAFVTKKDSSMQLLPSLEGMPFGFAMGINDPGDIVGTMSPIFTVFAPPGVMRAALWRKGQVYNLNDMVESLPGNYVLSQAISINNRGQILSYADDPGTGEMNHPFLLTPKR